MARTSPTGRRNCKILTPLRLPPSQWRSRPEIDFHCWLQWLMDEQLAGAQQAARRAGMALGVMHDLAVGVHPRGADAWSLQDSYAAGVTVGAPPDAFNQHGQDWSQPPWRPDRLAATAYAPVPRHGLDDPAARRRHPCRPCHRAVPAVVDPAGCTLPQQGTYVRYDHEAMIGILALEAHRAGALVVGEDLGTVEPWVRDYLRERGILGTSILWFEFDWDGDGEPLRAGEVAGVLPRLGHHPRPAAHGRLSGR